MRRRTRIPSLTDEGKFENPKVFCINCEQEVDLEQLTDLDICEECYEQQTIDNQLF